MGFDTVTMQGNPEAIPFLIASAVATTVAAVAWRRRGAPGGPALTAMMLGEAGWALFEAAELLIVDPPIKRLCFALRVGAAVATVLGLLRFVLRYTGHTRWLAARRFGLVSAPAFAPLILAWTNELHHLYWAALPSASFVQSYGTFELAVPAYGPVFWLHFGYCYFLLAVAAALLFVAVRRSVGIYRSQAGVMLLGVLLPWAVNIVDMTRLLGYIHVDAVAIAFAVTGLAFLPAFYRYRLLDLAPIAWAAVVRAMADPVVVLDASRRVVDVNAAAERVFGETRAEVIGLAAATALRGWPDLSDRLGAVGSIGGSPFDLDGRDRAEGRSFEAQISDLEDGGRPAGWVIVLRDVTERRRAEAERAARAEAEAGARARESFLAVLSHELRTPLTPVLIGVEALLGNPATPDSIRPTLSTMLRNVELEARLIDDLLDLTCILQGRLRLNPEVIDAHVPIWHALETCDSDVRAKGLSLEIDLAAEPSHVSFDPARLQQVAWNLLKNAVKFTPAGGRVVVRTRGSVAHNSGGGPGMVLEVVDTGRGIDPATLPRIFDAFEQGDAETARRSGGLGLGLAICRQIVEAHGGRIAAASLGRGRGATFQVELSTVPAPEPPERPIEPRGGQVDRPTLRVLLVEDNADSRVAISQILSAEGFAIETAGDVRAAIALAGSKDFDVLVSDIGLPDGSGLDLMRTVRNLGAGTIAGIAISGYGADEDVRQSRDAGFAVHLIKPLRIRELSESILWAAGVGIGARALSDGDFRPPSRVNTAESWST